MPQSILNLQTPKACTCESCPMFKDYQDNGRGLCKIFDKVYKRHHALTLDCLSSLPSNVEDLISEEDRLYCKYSPGDIVKLINPNQDHSEWETFIVLGQKYNKGRFDSDESYLTQPDWYLFIASKNQPIPNPFWIAETDICLDSQAELIETAEVF